MPANTTQKLDELLELANNYPSPHNGQPMVLLPGSEGSLELYFETARGLSATPISYLFSFVSIGVFIRHLELCAQALGHKLIVHLALPDQSALATPGRVQCARLFVDYDVAAVDEQLRTTIEQRQTSRKKYTSGLDEQLQHTVHDIAHAHGIRSAFLSASQAQHAIWLNQRAVFDDMFDPAVRTELDHWLRYNATEKHDKKDGLSYDCMELSGGALHFAVRHYRILHWPIVAPLLRKYYLRTMRDSSSVGYLSAPFATEQHAYEIGRCVIDVWLELAKSGKYLHPFGTIVSNELAHQDFVQLAGLTDETRDSDYVVFIYRAGSSQPPVESERLPLADHLYQQGVIT